MSTVLVECSHGYGTMLKNNVQGYARSESSLFGLFSTQKTPSWWGFVTETTYDTNCEFVFIFLLSHSSAYSATFAYVSL